MEIEKPVQVGGGAHRISYAQNMEDILLDRLFGGTVGTFMDVGANHPFLDSNTYFFYVRGWRGVNLEPTPRGLSLFHEHRQDDTNLAVAASDADGEMAFYEVSGPEGMTGLSTLSAEIAEVRRAEGFTVVESRVAVRTVASLVEEHAIAVPDFLSIDVEGHEGLVIRGLPLATWRPKVLVVESTLPLSDSASHGSWEPTLIEHGYLFAAFNGVNRFYLRDDLREQLGLFQVPVNVLDHYQRHDTVHYMQATDRLRAEIGSEAERRALARELAQAELVLTQFDRERLAFEQQRDAWADAQEFHDQERASWEWERRRYEYDRGAWEQARSHHDRERAEAMADRAAMAVERAAMEAERLRMDGDRDAWDRLRAEYARLLADSQRQLRPYRLIDRLGVVSKGYGLARRVKRRLAS